MPQWLVGSYYYNRIMYATKYFSLSFYDDNDEYFWRKEKLAIEMAFLTVLYKKK